MRAMWLTTRADSQSMAEVGIDSEAVQASDYVITMGAATRGSPGRRDRPRSIAGRARRNRRRAARAAAGEPEPSPLIQRPRATLAPGKNV